jgi:hypothetical protein
MERLKRGDAHTPIAFPNEQLHALTGRIPQDQQGFTSGLGERQPIGGDATQRNQAGAQSEASVSLSTHQSVCLKGFGKTVRRSAGQASHLDQLGQRHGTFLKSGKDLHRLVEDSHTTYTVSHKARLSSHYVRHKHPSYKHLRPRNCAGRIRGINNRSESAPTPVG